MNNNTLKIGLAQLSPVWLNRQKTLEKILECHEEAAVQGCGLLVFGETYLPGYPFWIELTDGARFNSQFQKEMHAHYFTEAVQIERGDLSQLCEACKAKEMAVIIGCLERPIDRGGHSVYCSLVYIDQKGVIQSVHRKLMPTYEERLSWAPGDGHGLRVHPIGEFTLGALNCWENWMPLVRASLYGMGEDLHIAIWPGNVRNTEILTRSIAEESRSYVVSVCSVLKREQIPADIPHAAEIIEKSPEALANGGSCVANPDGSWLLPPQANTEGLFTVEIDHERVKQERQNFDPSGHYSRPDVTQLTVNRKRQSVLKIED